MGEGFHLFGEVGLALGEVFVTGKEVFQGVHEVAVCRVRGGGGSRRAGSDRLGQRFHLLQEGIDTAHLGHVGRDGFGLLFGEGASLDVHNAKFLQVVQEHIIFPVIDQERQFFHFLYHTTASFLSSSSACLRFS